MQVISDVVEVGVPILAGGPCRFRLGLGYSARGLGWTCQTTPSSREGSVSQTREREAVSTRGFGRFVPARFFSPHLRRLRELVWVGGCVTVPVAWASGPSALASRGPWGRRCRGTRDTARSRESGLVARRPGAGTCGVGLPPGAKECTQIGENGLLELFRTICVHCCDVVDRRGDAGVYTDRRKRPLGAVLGHSCTLLRREDRASCDAHCVGWHEWLKRHGMPASPPLVGKTGSARVAQPLA